MYNKNELKNLIYIQENKPCNEQTIKGLFRSIVEPILEKNTESLVLFRLEDKSQNDFSSILKRLEFSNSTVYDFSDSSVSDKFENILKEKIWNKTEFLYVLGDRFGAVLIFDYEESELDGFAQIYILHNSKNLSDVFAKICSNSIIDLSKYEEMWRPDRRDNELLNISIRKIVENLNETNQEILISQMEKETAVKSDDAQSKLNFLSAKSSYLSHEMRNLISICSLYSTIIEKQSAKINFEDSEIENSFKNAFDCINKSLAMASNLILDFKSLKSVNLQNYDLKNLLNTAVQLSQVYTSGKKITVENKFSDSVNVLIDENKFLSVLINLIKNAIESMNYEDDVKDRKEYKVVIDATVKEDSAQVVVSNNGKVISKEFQAKIFEEGFTTKSTGSGLGLVICKKTLEEQYAQLKLSKSDEDSTDFEINVLRGV